jgi:hypothetical protein
LGLAAMGDEVGQDFNGCLNYDELYLVETYDDVPILHADGLILASVFDAFVPLSKLLSEKSRLILCLNPCEGQAVLVDLRFLYLQFRSLL